jgi:diphthine-ammonia ligase
MSKLTGCSWSGGKDSCFALMQAIKNGYTPVVLVNMMNENGKISRSHGLPFSILMQQANAMGLPIVAVPSTWADYEKNFVDALHLIKKENGAAAMAFGDIDLQAHRDWEEMVCAKAGLTALLPLWKGDRKALVLQMLDAGIETMIVSCNIIMGEEFLGKTISHELILQLEEKGVDVCGENGEFHTVVTNCPLFSHEIQLPSFTRVLHDNYWFIQWQH